LGQRALTTRGKLTPPTLINLDQPSLPRPLAPFFFADTLQLASKDFKTVQNLFSSFFPGTTATVVPARFYPTPIWAWHVSSLLSLPDPTPNSNKCT
jgi:hypothetical protein